MGLSHDVKIRGTAAPEWPFVCPSCYRPEPDGVFVMRSSRIGWHQLLTLSWAFGSRPKLRVPACRGCAKRMRAERWGRETLSWVGLFIMVGVVYLVLDALGLLPSGPLRRWAIAGIFLVVVIPAAMVTMFFPPVLDATASGNNVTYEFKNKEYADHFRDLNQDRLAPMMFEDDPRRGGTA